MYLWLTEIIFKKSEQFMHGQKILLSPMHEYTNEISH